MTIHMLKLCVGADEIDDLVAWQARLMRGADRPYHHTRMVPKRGDEIDVVRLEQDGHPVAIPHDQIKKAHLVYEF